MQIKLRDLIAATSLDMLNEEREAMYNTKLNHIQSPRDVISTKAGLICFKTSLFFCLIFVGKLY